MATADTPALWVLREVISMPAKRYGCGMALCAAARHVRRRRHRSCILYLEFRSDRHRQVPRLTTIEATSDSGGARAPRSEAWLRHGRLCNAAMPNREDHVGDALPRATRPDGYRYRRRDVRQHLPRGTYNRIATLIKTAGAHRAAGGADDDPQRLHLAPAGVFRGGAAFLGPEQLGAAACLLRNALCRSPTPRRAAGRHRWLHANAFSASAATTVTDMPRSRWVRAHTAIPMLIAERLGLGLKTGGLEHAPPTRGYTEKTAARGGASRQTAIDRDYGAAWQPLREAGATRGTMLVAGGAKAWMSIGIVPRAKRRRVHPRWVAGQIVSLPQPPAADLSQKG